MCLVDRVEAGPVHVFRELELDYLLLVDGIRQDDGGNPRPAQVAVNL